MPPQSAAAGPAMLSFSSSRLLLLLRIRGSWLTFHALRRSSPSFCQGGRRLSNTFYVDAARSLRGDHCLACCRDRGFCVALSRGVSHSQGAKLSSTARLSCPRVEHGLELTRTSANLRTACKRNAVHLRTVLCLKASTVCCRLRLGRVRLLVALKHQCCCVRRQ
jgi:hypothetical protein